METEAIKQYASTMELFRSDQLESEFGDSLYFLPPELRRKLSRFSLQGKIGKQMISSSNSG